MSPSAGFSGVVRRRRASIITMVAALFVVPAAIAYACNPQAHVSLDKSTYQPGAAITVYGSYFVPNANIAVSGPSGSGTVKASGGGGFVYKGLVAPSAPGNYTITASRPTGGFAPTSFSVAAPAQPAPSAAAAPTAAAPSAPAASAPAGPATKATAPKFKAPSIARSQAPASGERSTRATPSTASPRASRSTATTTATSSGGQQVFSGSTAQAAPSTTFAPAPAAATGTSRSGSGSGSTKRTATTPPVAAPAEQAALSDLFSNYEPGRTPSLMGAVAGAPQGGAGSGLGLGIGLLAFGLVSLVAGLTAAEVRRRRPA